jgi:hypothetical protein
MDVHETSEIRALAPDELDAVSGGFWLQVLAHVVRGLAVPVLTPGAVDAILAPIDWQQMGP